jgi:rSAM/selenodomain-associated transferase 1
VRSARERVIVFSRFPVPGQAKTRLIPALGPAGAADLQRQMTEHTMFRLLGPDFRRECSVEVRYEGADRKTVRDWLGSNLMLRSQGAGDLGQRMTRALREAFQAGMQHVVVIGTDCPGLNSGNLKEALASLETHTAVIGPATDGGYYLVGLSRFIPEMFEDIDWGTDRVLKQTLARAAKLGIAPRLLTPLDDIDRPEDLAVWERESGRNVQRQSLSDAAAKNVR